MKIIPYDRDETRYDRRYIRTISCTDCGNGASLVLEELTITKRSQFHERFIAGILARMYIDQCTCDTDAPEPDGAWVDGLVTENFK